MTTGSWPGVSVPGYVVESGPLITPLAADGLGCRPSKTGCESHPVRANVKSRQAINPRGRIAT